MENIRDLTTKIRDILGSRLGINRTASKNCEPRMIRLQFRPPCFPIVISPTHLDPVAIKDVQMHEIRSGSQRPSRLRGQHRQVARQHRGPHADRRHGAKRQEAEAAEAVRTGQGPKAEQKGPTVPWAQPWRILEVFDVNPGLIKTLIHKLNKPWFLNPGLTLLMFFDVQIQWSCSNLAVNLQQSSRTWPKMGHLEVEDNRVTGSPGSMESMARPRI